MPRPRTHDDRTGRVFPDHLITSQHTHTAHVTWVQAAGETVRTARSARGNTGTRAGPNGETGEKCASLTPGSAHCTGKPRGSGWDSGRTKLPNPRAPPMPSDADRGGGWERVRRHHRAGGSLGPPPRVSVNLVPLLLTGVQLHLPRHPRADRQAPLPMFRCPGHARTTTAPAGSSLIT